MGLLGPRSGGWGRSWLARTEPQVWPRRPQRRWCRAGGSPCRGSGARVSASRGGPGAEPRPISVSLRPGPSNHSAPCGVAPPPEAELCSRESWRPPEAAAPPTAGPGPSARQDAASCRPSLVCVCVCPGCARPRVQGCPRPPGARGPEKRSPARLHPWGLALPPVPRESSLVSLLCTRLSLHTNIYNNWHRGTDPRARKGKGPKLIRRQNGQFSTPSPPNLESPLFLLFQSCLFPAKPLASQNSSIHSQALTVLLPPRTLHPTHLIFKSLHPAKLLCKLRAVGVPALPLFPLSRDPACPPCPHWLLPG